MGLMKRFLKLCQKTKKTTKNNFYIKQEKINLISKNSILKLIMTLYFYFKLLAVPCRGVYLGCDYC